MRERKSYIYTDSFGDDNTLYPKLNFYVDDKNLYLGFDYYDPELDDIVPYCDATVNTIKLPFLESCIDTNNNGDKMVDFLLKNGFGELTGSMIPSGYYMYPVFRFYEDKLREIDSEVFSAYAKAHGMERPSLTSKITEAENKPVTHKKPRQDPPEMER